MAPVADLTGIDPARRARLEEEELARFVAARPRSVALTRDAHRTMPRGVPMSWMDDLYEHPTVWVRDGSGSSFTDVDGHTYLDMYLADMSAFCGHAPRPVVEAVSRRIASGNQFLLPAEEAIPLAQHLAGRYGMPKWQFTLSATQANTEVIRIARHLTGREIVVMFDGKYHGHLDPALVVLEDGRATPEYDGLPASIIGETRVVSFNDADALERALAPGDVAVVLAEPAMTNAGFLLPIDGYHQRLRRLTTDAGTLMAIDETHTLVCAHGGLTGRWGLEPDLLTIGKSIAAGVPLGAYGMTDAVASSIAEPEEPNVVSGAVVSEIATGGTLFANTLSLAAGLAALTEVLTEDAFERTARLGGVMADGLRVSIERHGLPWSVAQEGAHAAYFFEPKPPIDGAGSRDADDPDLRALVRLYLANRDVWESGWWLGPTVSVAHTDEDVARYVETFDGFLTDITGGGGSG